MTAKTAGSSTISTPSGVWSAAPHKMPGLESQLRRFDPQLRRRVRSMVRQHDRVADLVNAFPAAVHRLAEPSLTEQRRNEALQAIQSGSPLRSVAEALRLPFWLRRLPPDAFRGEIPPLPCSRDFNRKISTRLPRHRRMAHPWLEAVSFSLRAAGEDFALWVADRTEIIPRGMSAENALRVLAAYASVNRHGSGQLAQLLGTRWRSEMATDSALCGAMTWLNRVRLVTILRGKQLSPWLKPGTCNGYEFEPITTVEDFLLEAQLMHNCVDQYATLVCTDRCRLFSVRQGRSRVATVEVARHPKEPTVFTITQLKGPSNVPAPLSVWQAAYGWLASQDQLMSVPSLYSTAPRGQPRVWSALFDDYRAKHNGAPWWPLTPTANTMTLLDTELKMVAKQANVVSWLFR